MIKHFLRAAFLLAFIASPAMGADITCKAVGVTDGDTFTCLSAGNVQVKVRMAEIDTPESRQPYGSRAKQALSDLVFGKQVTLKVDATDRYGRTVARAFVGSTDVNAELVRHGAAWVYRQYSKDRSLLALEEQAKQEKRGLWALPESERVPPWEWRRGGKSSSASSATPASALSGGGLSATGSFSCSVRKNCGQMESCAEAQFHLKQCGNGRLDRDSDGIPCESICN